MSKNTCYLVLIPEQFSYTSISKQEIEFCTKDLKINMCNFEQAFERLKSQKIYKQSENNNIFCALMTLMQLKGVCIDEFDIDSSTSMIVNINNPVAVTKLKAALN